MIVAEAQRAPTTASGRGSIFAAPWDRLDDAALLAHMRSPRPVRVDLVVDADECSAERMAGILNGEFEFNGERHRLPDPPAWLDNPSADVEWHILLHKFYYAAGLGRDFLASGDARLARRWALLLDSWIATVPPGFIAADVTGRRVQNWIYSTRAFVAHGVPHVAPVEPAFLRRLLESIHQQVEFLCENLTPKRNHRTLELYAIFLAGVAFPEMARSAHWRQFALDHTVRNMREDLLADGVHCELSTDYHHLALRNWLHVRTLAVRNGVPVPPAMDELIERAMEFSLHVHKPDGVVPSLSDGDARSFLPLLAQGAELFGRDDMRWVASRGAAGQPPQATLAHFAASGYTVLRSGWGSGPQDFDQPQYLVFDSGPLGEGNHGHLDCLNFELAAYGRSLIVDPGRYTYSEAGNPNWRVHFRGTAAHNTICVDGRQQTRYAPKPIKEPSRHAQGSVRHKISGPAPDAALLECAQAEDLALLHGRAASHEYDAVHERVIVCIGGGLWIVDDWLRATAEHEYALHFQLGAAAQDQSRLVVGAHHAHLDSPGLLLAQTRPAGTEITLAEGWVSERYGFKQAAPKLRSVQRAADAGFQTVLVPWRGRVPRLVVRRVELGAAHGLRIEHDVFGAPRVDTWFHAQDRSQPLWCWDGHEFSGRWLHLQHGPDGRLLAAVSHDGAELLRDGRSVALGRATGQAAP